MIALEVLRQRAAVSTNTFGRLSNTTATTPNGSRTLRMEMPVAHAVHHRLETRGREREPVDERGRETVRLRGRHVLGVRRVDLRLGRIERVRDRDERGVLLCGCERAQRGRGGAGLHAHFMDLFFYGHYGSFS